MRCWRVALLAGGLVLAGPVAAEVTASDPACSSTRSKAEAVRAAARTPIAEARALPAEGAVECLPGTPLRGTGWVLCLALLTAMVVTGGQAARRRSSRVVFS